jgi:hypothetical protein
VKQDYFTPNLATQVVNTALNDVIERTSAANAELPRPYLGASIAGSECLRRVQYDWWCTPMHSARTLEIFARGHYFEERIRRQFHAAGFKFAPPEACAFSAVNGDLRGHADGIINGGPNPLNGAYFNYPFIWECKALNAKNWRALGRDGLKKTFPRYSAQVALYQAYLNLTNAALLSAINVDTCEQLHFWVPFDAKHAQLWSDRVANVIAATRAGELLDRAYDGPDDWRCRMCPHIQRCWL